MIHLLATDMDGTLLNSKKEFDDEFFDVLQNILERDMYFVIASGNQFYHLYNQFLPFSNSLYFISEMVHLLQKVQKSFTRLLWIIRMFK